MAVFGFFHLTDPLGFDSLSSGFDDTPLIFDDPTILAAHLVLVSGDYSGYVYEHELTSHDNGVAIEASIELGPYPKDPAARQIWVGEPPFVPSQQRSNERSALETSVGRPSITSLIEASVATSDPAAVGMIRSPG